MKLFKKLWSYYTALTLLTGSLGIIIGFLSNTLWLWHLSFASLALYLLLASVFLTALIFKG